MYIPEKLANRKRNRKSTIPIEVATFEWNGVHNIMVY